jgi:hypothetical protein
MANPLPTRLMPSMQCIINQPEKPIQQDYAGMDTHLDGEAAADTLDAVHDVHALVDADDVGVGCRHALQQAAAAADVQDDGQAGVRLLHAVNHLRYNTTKNAA